MRELFNRRFWIYFATTFMLALIFTALGAANNYLDLFLGNSVPFITFSKLCLYVAMGMIPASLCISTALASFISFRYLSPETEINGFFRKLGVGLLCFIPLSLAIYMYDLYIQPYFQVKATEILWEMKTGNSPRIVDDDPWATPVFQNYRPSLSSKEVLYFRLDSLENECDKLKIECSRLLALLPDSAAIEAHQAYQLEWLGVDYQHAPSSMKMDIDSIIHIQQVELFETAGHLHDTNSERLMYRYESYKRTLNAITLLLDFLLFATLGYFLRKKMIKNILGIIAIFIVAILFLHQITNMGTQFARKAYKTADTYKRNMR